MLPATLPIEVRRRIDSCLRNFRRFLATADSQQDIKNRIVSTAHGTVFTEDGMPADRERRYYLEKARGGAGP